MILRKQELAQIRQMSRVFGVVGILGARQVGKTTLAMQYAKTFTGPTHRFDLENPRDLAILDDPMAALEDLRGLIVLDEIQRRPELFPVLRVLVDQRGNKRRFLVLGSASPELLRQSSESLTGRIGYLEIGGFGLEQVGADKMERLWLRGGMPRSFLARSNAESYQWRVQYLRSYVERELLPYGVRIPSRTLDDLLHMLAHYHGQILNLSELGRAFGRNDQTIQRYVDLFGSTFLIRRLQPWHENLKKRQVKRPKVYIADTGVLHCLLEVRDQRGLHRHPKVGFSWESFAMEVVLRRLRADYRNCYFWATHTGAELDLLVVRGNQRMGFEFKRNSAPTVTKSMRIVMQDLRLKNLVVVHPGRESWKMSRGIRALALTSVQEELKPMH